MLENTFETLFFFQPRAGALQQLGHMDFYPDGGSSQVLSSCHSNHDLKSLSAVSMLSIVKIDNITDHFWHQSIHTMPPPPHFRVAVSSGRMRSQEVSYVYTITQS